MPKVLYQCVVGHEIRADELDQATELTILDNGASIRICRRHGAPISVDHCDGTLEGACDAKTGEPLPQAPGA
ncbi:MAG TPA: hypothetical protein VF898_05755 [Chloroflexota bacterium]